MTNQPRKMCADFDKLFRHFHTHQVNVYHYWMKRARWG
jgi:hypothetical protein